MIDAASQVINIIHQGNVFPAQKMARSFAQDIGFRENECEQLAIVASELASNLIKHANGGTIKFIQITEPTRIGIQIESEDNGLGMFNTNDSLTDGFSTGNGLGFGLGAVNRLMDNLDIITPAEGGTRIICNRWLRPSDNHIFSHLLEFGVATRPHKFEKDNGDSFVIKCWKNCALVGVIDGLGHGSKARKAALCARNYIEDHFDQPLENIFKGVDRACRSTRGVVIALALFNLDTKIFQLASVGNIESRLFGSNNPTNFAVRRGIVGLNAPKAAVSTHQWTDKSILILYSDGLHSKWDYNDFSEEIWTKPEVAAHTILAQQGKDNDDATIVIVKNSKANG